MKAIKWKVLGKLQNSKTPSNKKEEIVNILLENRGIKKRQEREEFLNPIHPRDLTLEELKVDKTQVEKTIRRIKAAIVNKEKIIVYGDYDADGVSGTAILWEALWGLKADVLPYIPERFSEGYGLNAESVKNLKSKYKNLKLIITVDNGIVARDAVKKAKDIGINVIITDHHEPSAEAGKLPPAYAILNPKQPACLFPFKELAGVGVAFNLVIALRAKLRGCGMWGEGETKPNLKKYTDIVALGTIADMVPLVDENRILVKYGLEELTLSKRPGIRALKEVSGLKDVVKTGSVGFQLAPRINAAGRLDNAGMGVRLLITDDDKEAIDIAKKLDACKCRYYIFSLDKIPHHVRGCFRQIQLLHYLRAIGVMC